MVKLKSELEYTSTPTVGLFISIIKLSLFSESFVNSKHSTRMMIL